MTMLIKQLLSGRRKSNFILLKDNTQFNGFSIVKKFISENKQRFTRIHLILTELIRTDIKEGENIVIHNFFPDPWNLLEGREAELTFEQIIECILSERSLNERTNTLFIIDSIAGILEYINLYTLCTSINKLVTSSKKEETSGVQVLTCLHSDMFSDESKEYKYLLYMATSILTCCKVNQGAEMTLEHHQSNGKIIKETYCCNYGPKKEFQFEIKKEKPNEPPEEAHEKIVSTTFKLTLEEKEKESRSQVVLPYLKASNTLGKGRIFYEPDVNDDWDDEDPDDDLEI